ncbi:MULTISPECIES: hypothetical protein [Brenneria]|uniref:Uncharacterized protein n=1 Tax=Brenneria nigrifluens DSM 30175 = ATCC 13028 TaxID=1121120 RepID=A0A2U1UNS8_9GAMM|nr:MULTISPECIES: hypothetical protein [Brenneria]EHD19631.1 hypothetical protein BrE312_0172 [Brenneria sp. EniD312]PWC23271.1 hypothetical protein DDT54_15650 [Brenneria nigrifluens DSM 30175 = ATCC 13028]QCR02896.1 hypothetical protein EH206_00870 [Brenneria nigrifluens DSM 30175 = ATCC 13028]
MAEYQYYRFERQDGVLSPEQRRQLRTISSRAEIDSIAFSVYYHYGDLNADPDELMMKYFDIGFYYANWGQVIAYLKLPFGTLPQEFMAIDDDVMVSITEDKDYQLLTFSLDEDERYREDEDAKAFLSHLSALRAELLAEDYRVLYLPWLSRAYDGEDLDKLPLIAFDFNKLTGAQLAFAELFNIRLEAVRALSMLLTSSPSHVVDTKVLSPEQQVAALSSADKDRLLCLLFEQGQLALTQVRMLIREPLEKRNYQYWLSAASLQEYWPLASDEIKRERLAAEEKRLAQEQVERRTRLNTVFAARTTHWDSAIKCAEQGHASAYNQATSILQELFDAYQTNEALAEFITPYQSFIEQHKKRKALIGRLESLTQKVMGGKP